MRIHLAGNGVLESGVRGVDIVRQVHGNHPHRLQSYLDKDSAEFLPVAQSYAGQDDHILDSGLFSFMFGAHAGEMPKTLEAYQGYQRDYLAWIAQSKIPGNFVELDAQRLLGMEATTTLRKAFEPHGDRVIYTWHLPEGLDGLVKLAEEKSYIAISVPELRVVSGGRFSVGSGDVKRMCDDLLRRVHEHCRRRGILPPRIHLLGCTVLSMMETRLAYSCDSTSWMSGVRYGQISVFTKDKKLSTANVRSPAAIRYKARAMERLPLVADLVKALSGKARDRVENRAASGMAFCELQNHLNQHFPPTETRHAQR